MLMQGSTQPLQKILLKTMEMDLSTDRKLDGLYEGVIDMKGERFTLKRSNSLHEIIFSHDQDVDRWEVYRALCSFWESVQVWPRSLSYLARHSVVCKWSWWRYAKKYVDKKCCFQGEEVPRLIIFAGTILPTIWTQDVISEIDWFWPYMQELRLVIW